MTASNVIDFSRERRRGGPRFNGGLMDILEVSRDLVCLCRAGEVAAINGAGLRLLGARSQHEVVGRRLSNFLGAECVVALDCLICGRGADTSPIAGRVVGLDQTHREVEFRVYRARELAEDATVVLARDLRPAGRTCELDSRFAALVDNAMNLMCHCVDGRIRYVNRAAIDMLGAGDAGDLLGLEVHGLFHGDYAGILDTLIEEKAAVPVRLRRMDGSAVDAQVTISRLASQQPGRIELMLEARDISAHLRAVDALRRANETLEMRVAQRTRELAAQRTLAEERKHAADASLRFTESLLDMIPSPVWFKDARGHYQIVNRAFRDLFLFAHARTNGVDVTDGCMPQEDGDSDRELLAGAITRANFEVGLRAVGTAAPREVLVTKGAYLDEDGRPVGIIGVMSDITERKQMERELRRLATTDPLTGAANRRSFMAAADQEVDRALRYGQPLSVVMIDIDHFKHINDSHGHAVGDEAIKAAVRSCRGQLRDVDLLGRLGGEEFAVLLPETGEQGAVEVAERLRRAIAGLAVPLPGGQVLSFTASLGLACRRIDEIGFADLLARADQALYRAKAAGRNRVVAAPPAVKLFVGGGV